MRIEAYFSYAACSTPKQMAILREHDRLFKNGQMQGVRNYEEWRRTFRTPQKRMMSTTQQMAVFEQPEALALQGLHYPCHNILNLRKHIVLHAGAKRHRHMPGANPHNRTVNIFEQLFGYPG